MAHSSGQQIPRLSSYWSLEALCTVIKPYFENRSTFNLRDRPIPWVNTEPIRIRAINSSMVIAVVFSHTQPLRRALVKLHFYT